MKLSTLVSVTALAITAAFSGAALAQVEQPAPAANNVVLKPVEKARIFKDNMDKDVHNFKDLSPRVYLFEDLSEKRSGYGVWWCGNFLSTRTWPVRVMFLSGLNGEGDYLLYFSNPSETRKGNTQRFSPNLFKNNEKGVFEKVPSGESKPSLKFEPKFKGAEMVSVAFSYSSPSHQDFKYLTRENCEKY
jgi:hypothetical protein